MDIGHIDQYEVSRDPFQHNNNIIISAKDDGEVLTYQQIEMTWQSVNFLEKLFHNYSRNRVFPAYTAK